MELTDKQKSYLVLLIIMTYIMGAVLTFGYLNAKGIKEHNKCAKEHESRYCPTDPVGSFLDGIVWPLYLVSRGATVLFLDGEPDQ